MTQIGRRNGELSRLRRMGVMDARDLIAGAGAELLAGVCADPRDDLALATALRKQTHEPGMVALALQQRGLRNRAHTRLRGSGQMLLTGDGLEQATSTAVARVRAERFAGLSRVADVCCGIGGDSRELAEVVDTIVGLDRDPVHLALARFNTAGRFYPACGDADALPLAGRGLDAILVDPARRDGGARRRGHEETSPSLATCLAWVDRVDRVAIKSAPGLDHDVIPSGWSIEAVAVGRELKEVTLWSPAWGYASRRATVIRGGVEDSHVAVFEGTGARGLLETAPVGRYLLDPSPAITRSGLVQELGASLGAAMLDERIAFLTTSTPLDSPFARTLEVLDVMQWPTKALRPLRDRLKALQIGQVEIRQRGVSLVDADDLRRRLAGSGERRATVVLTRVGQAPLAIICA